MKKLEEFQAAKIDLKSIKGGYNQLKALAEDTMTIVTSGTEVCDVKNDGPDGWPE